jgi:hypothetical protein
MPDGTIVCGLALDSTHLQVLLLGANGDVVESKEMETPWEVLRSVSYAYALDAERVILTGTALPVVGGLHEVHFAICLNLSTWEMKLVERQVESAAYGAGPKVSIGTDAIFISYPELALISVEKLDLDFNSLWARQASPNATFSGKCPTLGCMALPGGRVATIDKDDSHPSLGILDADGHPEKRYQFPALNSAYVRPYSMIVCADSSYLLSAQYGYSGAYPFLVRLEQDFSVRWATILDSNRAGGGLISRFVEVCELPDGRIAAFGAYSSSYSDNFYSAISLFEADGDWISTQNIAEAGKAFKLYDAEVYADGLVLSGIQAEPGNLQHLVINTGFDLSSVCPLVPIMNPGKAYDVGEVSQVDSMLYYYAKEPGSGASLAAVASSKPTLTFCGVITSTGAGTASSGLLAAPNPQVAGRDLRLVASTGSPLQVSWVDVQGRCLRRERLEAGQTQLSTAGLEPGVYTLIVGSGETVSTQKVVLLR